MVGAYFATTFTALTETFVFGAGAALAGPDEPVKAPMLPAQIGICRRP
jgi:hypothetical protein